MGGVQLDNFDIIQYRAGDISFSPVPSSLCRKNYIVIVTYPYLQSVPICKCLTVTVYFIASHP